MMTNEGIKHDLDDTEWWRAHFIKYGMDPDEILTPLPRRTLRAKSRKPRRRNEQAVYSPT